MFVDNYLSNLYIWSFIFVLPFFQIPIDLILMSYSFCSLLEVMVSLQIFSPKQLSEWQLVELVLLLEPQLKSLSSEWLQMDGKKSLFLSSTLPITHPLVSLFLSLYFPGGESFISTVPISPKHSQTQKFFYILLLFRLPFLSLDKNMAVLQIFRAQILFRLDFS